MKRKTKFYFNKLLRFQSIVAILVLFFGINLQAANSIYAQEAKISINLKKGTYKEVFKAIEKNTDFVIFYYDDILDFNRTIDIQVKNQTVDKILDQLFKGTNNSYTIEDKQIYITNSKKQKNNLPNLSTLQQDLKITGKVVDSTGEPLAGAAIQIKGTTRGVTTDLDGTFTIECKKGESLVISYLGMQTQTIQISDQKILNIKMEDQGDLLDEVTVVAFAKQKKESVVASVSTIKPAELKVPSSNLTNAFAGRIAGVISYQRSGEPGQDNADFFVRGVTTFGYGNSPLILIDGIEMSSTDLARLNTDDIESFSIMKDANATALYGARGANGVIYVKTKEGRAGKTNVSFRAETSISTPANDIELADPITYMRQFNEATFNRDPFAILPFSTKKIEMTERGIDPLLYPAVDWQKTLFKNNTVNQRYNISISGGGDRVQYYVAGSYSKDNGILKADKINNFDNNIDIDRYMVRSNTTMNFGKLTKATVRVSATFNDQSGPLDSGTTIFNNALKASPVLFHPYYPKDEKHKYTQHVLFGNYGADAKYLNPYAQMVRGFKDSKESTMVAQIELEQDFKFITEGLKGRLLVNSNRYSYFDSKREFKPFYYEATQDLEGEYMLRDLNENTGQEYLSFVDGYKDVTSTFYLEGQLAYNRLFADKHNVSGMLVYTMRDYLKPGKTLQLSLPSRNIGLSGRFTYGYDSKYFAEFNFGYNGSERFDKNNRFGFFPAIGLGYMISNESFYPTEWKNVVDNLKFKYTWGKVGNDRIGSANDRFFYLSEVNPSDNNNGFTFGTDFGYTRPGVSIKRYADSNITWEVATKQNYGIEFDLLKDIKVQADYFREKRTQILMERAHIPTIMGLQAKPKSNVGEASGEGFEFSIDGNKYLSKDWWLSARVNFTYATGHFKKYEEPDFSETPWLYHNGQKLTQQWGLIAERLFVDQYEVDNSPKQTFGQYGPGDIKYKDLNGDFVIDEKDRAPIGYPTSPEIIYGFGISTGFKGFDISCFFQGSGKSSFWIDPIATAPFIGNTAPQALLKVWADDHWTTQNQNSFAQWPKLSDEINYNNNQKSTWFMRDGTFLRFKTLEIGYTLPQQWTRKIGMKMLRIYFSGNNLACWSNFDLWDPEMAGNGLGYPLQRVYNIGLNVQF